MLVGFLCFLSITSFMAFSWIIALVVLMTGSLKEREPKRAKNEEDQTGTSQQGNANPASPGSDKSTDWKMLSDENEGDDEAAEAADQEDHPVHSPVYESTEGRRTRSRNDFYTESLISSQPGHLVPIRLDEMTAPTQPSIIHEGESSSQNTPTLSSVHQEQQRLIADLDELEAKVDQLTTIASDCRKEIQSISNMVKTILDRLGFHVSDTSDSD